MPRPALSYLLVVLRLLWAPCIVGRQLANSGHYGVLDSWAVYLRLSPIPRHYVNIERRHTDMT